MSKESMYFQLSDIDGKHDAKELKRELDAFRGVISVSVNAEKDTLAVDFDNTGVKSEQLEKCIEQLGYKVESKKNETHIM